VAAGENAGRELRHIAVVTAIIKAGKVQKGRPCLVGTTLAVERGMRITSWAREAATGLVLATCRITES
jgi:hypothetical protein